MFLGDQDRARSGRMPHGPAARPSVNISRRLEPTASPASTASAHAAMEDVHARVWVGPSVAQGGGVEIAPGVAAPSGTTKSSDPSGNQKPNGELNGRHVIDQAGARPRVEGGLDRSLAPNPRQEWDEGGRKCQVHPAGEPDEADEIIACVALVEDSEDSVVDRFHCRGDKKASRAGQGLEVVRVLQ